MSIQFIAFGQTWTMYPESKVSTNIALSLHIRLSMISQLLYQAASEKMYGLI